MAITKQTMDVAIEQIKDFFKNLFNPNMKIEDIADVVSSRLDPIIIEHEKNGLHYSAGKFYIKAADDEHFQLEFEIFFKDDEDKWHKLANQSELRDIKLLEEGAAKTIQKLKAIEFPINAPEIKPIPEVKKNAIPAAEKSAETENSVEDEKAVESEETVEVEIVENKTDKTENTETENTETKTEEISSVKLEK